MLALQITPALRVLFCIDIYGDRIYNKDRKTYGDRTYITGALWQI